jgi:hypothetical protein
MKNISNVSPNDTYMQGMTSVIWFLQLKIWLIPIADQNHFLWSHWLVIVIVSFENIY